VQSAAGGWSIRGEMETLPLSRRVLSPLGAASKIEAVAGPPRPTLLPNPARTGPLS